MSAINEIYDLYDAYIRKTEELNRNKKITDGLLGITKGPKDDPCHDQFIDDLQKKIAAFSDSQPASAEVYTLLDFMYTAPLSRRDDHMVYWMFMAVHTLAFDLIDRLCAEDAEKLYLQYMENYPRHEQLPAQKKTLKALKKKAHIKE